MRQLLTLALLLCLCQVRAQVDIIGFEYWFDQNDATSTWVDVPDATSINDLPSIAVTGLAIGPHRFNLRLKDSNGHWSSVVSRSFHVNFAGPFEIVALRYWSDQASTNPGDLRDVAVNSPAEVLDMVADIEFCHQQVGAHSVFFQLKDNHGVWSSVITRAIDVDAVGPPPAPEDIDGPLYVLPGETVTYKIDTVLGATGYEWTLPADWSGSSTDTSITVTAGNILGAGAISVVAVNGCGQSAPSTLDISTGIANLSATGAVSIYPNPTNGPFFLDLNGTARVAVLDAAGRQVLAERQLQGQRHVLDLATAANGLYTVRIVHDGVVECHRLIVQH